MKHFWTALISLLILTSCDDGDIIEDTFNFTNATVQKCSSTNVLYKINDKEALVFSTPESSFPNEEGTQNLTVNSSNSVVYKKFSAATNASNICDTPTLTVTEEWNVTGGTIEIITTKIPDTNDPNKTVGYNHKITFKNITFNAPGKEIVYDSYEFGSYRTDVVDLKFDYTAAVMQDCAGNNLIFKYNNNNALLLDIDPTLYQHQTVGTKTALIGAVNKVTYRVYNGNLNSSYFCQAIPPSSPTLTEEWVAQDGVTGVSGIIVVETEQQTTTTYRHVIKLRKTTFKKGVLTYSPAPEGDYTFGEIIN
ncbi:hypothetical protein [Flavobacterium sp. H122]|uniref:hypothetical protein n=1 Tax=Flavobacterium sp. H122 TaxID=2529860 RepID=UPI0010AB1275|nr:hypothetical protein [Flavobacterium sp. H122]